MKTTTTLIATALLIGAAAVNAQTPTAPRVPFGTGELAEFLKPYDLDGDGKLSVEERQAFVKACREAIPSRPGIRNRWDTDGDGKLSPEEIQAARDAIAAKMTEMRTKRFEELDLIPRITDEMIARMIAHLDQADEAGVKDGKISLAEFLAVLKPVPPPVPPFPLPQPLPQPRDPGMMCPPILRVFDTNKNGLLTTAEINAMKAVLDTDADGRISFEEWKTYVEAHPEMLPPSGGRM
jgi:Ca2+-binding EF-hand superfamily protein